jgi:hypothetical protein
MAYETKELSGSMFKNDEKVEETHADFNGSAKIGGQDYWVNAWVKTYEKDGQKRKYFSLSFKPKKPAAGAPQKPKKGAEAFDDMEDSIPF